MCKLGKNVLTSIFGASITTKVGGGKRIRERKEMGEVHPEPQALRAPLASVFIS